MTESINWTVQIIFYFLSIAIAALSVAAIFYSVEVIVSSCLKIRDQIRGARFIRRVLK